MHQSPVNLKLHYFRQWWCHEYWNRRSYNVCKVSQVHITADDLSLAARGYTAAIVAS